jgi:glycerol-3-phosphate acyltransferase PlsY
VQTLIHIPAILASYLIGAIPFGYLIVKILKGEDIREFQSGRTGGTNAMRVAGTWIGLFTAVLDCLKGAGVVWLARLILPGYHWLEILCPIAAIIGHNWSIFLLHRSKSGVIKFGGGAGGAPSVGGSLGLWAPSALIIIPIVLGIFYFIGYASVATLTIALLSMIIFGVRTYLGLSPWWYILFGLLSEIIIVVSLRPNITRLIKGTERLHGFRAKFKNHTTQVSMTKGN